MSDREEPSEILFAYRASCRGFVPTNMDPSLALQAITFIANGGTFYPPSALRLIKLQASDGDGGGSGTRPVSNEGGKQQAASPGRSGQDGEGNGRLTLESMHVEAECDDAIGGRKGLTHRQHEVLELLRRGQPNKIIARELGLTEGTVKVHVRQIMRKLGAANRTQAAVCSASEELFYGVGELGLRREHVS
jgi:DNA-binding NarL/FixJ family response regulator